MVMEKNIPRMSEHIKFEKKMKTRNGSEKY